MAEADTSSESRWRLGHQSMAVQDLAGDLRAALAGDDGRPADWPALHAGASGALGEQLREHAAELDLVESAAADIEAHHRTVLAQSTAVARETVELERSLVVTREHLLHATVAADASTAAHVRLSDRLEQLRHYL